MCNSTESEGGRSSDRTIKEFPSILRLLGQGQILPKIIREAKNPSGADMAQESSGLQKIESEIAAAAGLLRPLGPCPQSPATGSPGPRLEGLLRTIAKFEKPDRSRFVDVFE